MRPGWISSRVVTSRREIIPVRLIRPTTSSITARSRPRDSSELFDPSIYSPSSACVQSEGSSSTKSRKAGTSRPCGKMTPFGIWISRICKPTSLLLFGSSSGFTGKSPVLSSRMDSLDAERLTFSSFSTNSEISKNLVEKLTKSTETRLMPRLKLPAAVIKLPDTRIMVCTKRIAKLIEGIADSLMLLPTSCFFNSSSRRSSSTNEPLPSDFSIQLLSVLEASTISSNDSSSLISLAWSCPINLERTFFAMTLFGSSSSKWAFMASFRAFDSSAVNGTFVGSILTAVSVNAA